MDQLSQYLSMGLMILGGLAFTVSVITQVIKGLSFLKKIPTDLVVLVISLVVTITGYYIASDVLKYEVVWYGVAGSVVASFFVAFIATYGWTKFHDMWARFKKK
jgi:amino acid transporter